MPTLGIITGKATSLVNVANDIAYAFRNKGYETIVSVERIIHFRAKEMFDKAIIFMVFDPFYIAPYLLNYLNYNRYGIKTVMYIDTAGKPKPYLIRDWMKKGIKYVSNSNFSRSMLVEAGIPVLDVVYHGINLEDVEVVKNDAEDLKNEFKERLGVNVLFGTVCTNHPKKNLRVFSNVVRKCVERLRDAGFVIVSKPEAEPLFKGVKNVVFDDSMGKMPRLESLALIGSFDYLIHPSISEGFGMPVLEAQAFGVPPIHGDYAPLTEISLKEASLRVAISRIDFNNFEEGIFYKCHHYEVEDMVEQVEKAYDIYNSMHEDYVEMSSKCLENAKRFDAKNIYLRLEKYIQ